MARAAHLLKDNAGVLRGTHREQKSRVEQKGNFFTSFMPLLCTHLKALEMSQAQILAHFPSQMRKNHQATMKTRYCGHLYSSLLRKRTWWGHRDQVSYYMEGGLKGTEGSPPRAGWGLCRSPSKHFTLVGLPFGSL